MSQKCRLCKNEENKIVFNEFGIDILRCNKCGHVYSSYDQEQNYSDYYGKKIEKEDHFWWEEAHERMYKDFGKKFLKNKKGKILDVGCGLGYFLKHISLYNDWDAYGCEISQSAVDFAKNKLDIKNVICGKIEGSDYPNNYFDIITLWDVIEHIPDPFPLLKYLNSILKEGGILFIHTPNINIQLSKARIKKLLKGMCREAHYLEAKDHINIYSPKTMKRVLDECGYKKTKFIQLHPIQSVSGSKSVILKIIKNSWYYFSKVLFYLTIGKININNLFVIASK